MANAAQAAHVFARWQARPLRSADRAGLRHQIAGAGNLAFQFRDVLLGLRQ